MKYVLLLTDDQRATMQVNQWMKGMHEEVHIEIFKDMLHFNALLFPHELTDQEKKQIQASTSNEENKTNVFRAAKIKDEGVDLIIVDQEFLKKQSPVKWVVELKAKMTATILSHGTRPTRFMLIGFDSPTNPIDNLISDEIDDLVLKPLDQQVFQQKLMMALADDRTKKGDDYLFQQQIDALIYMAKAGEIEEVSEIGVGIKSKSKIREGLTARLYSKIFGEKQDSSLLARLYTSRIHPTVPDYWINYYTFFGINRNQMNHIRRALMGTRKPGSGARPLSKPEIEILKKNQKHIAVLAFNKEVQESIKTTIETQFINLHVHNFSSIGAFAKQVGMNTAQVVSSPVSVTDQNIPAFLEAQFSFMINADFELMNIEHKLPDKQTYLGISASELQKDPALWKRHIHPEDSEEVEEFLNHLKHSNSGHTIIRLKSPNGFDHYVKMDGQNLKLGLKQQFRIIMSELKGQQGHDQWLKHRPGNILKNQLDQLYAIFIDASSMSTPVADWVHTIKAFLDKTQALTASKSVAVVAMLPEGSKVNLEDFENTLITDVLYLPLDRKLLFDKVALYVPGAYNDRGPVQVQYTNYPAKVQLGQKVKMEMASEFGLQINSSKAFREGVFLRFFSPYFLDENNEGILARSYSATEDKDNKGRYHNLFSFYGISDAFLKHIRTWIRDMHIHKKDTGS